MFGNRRWFIHLPVRGCLHEDGVTLADLLPRSQTQAGLFDSSHRWRSARRMGVVDAVNAGAGRGTIRFAAEGLAASVGSAGWQTLRRRPSPNYTTRWDELPVAWAP